MNLRSTSMTLAVAAMGFCVPVCAQTVERPVYKVGDTWTYRHTEGPTPGSPGTYISSETKTVTAVRPDEFELSVVMTSDRGERKTSTQLSSLDFNDFAQPNPNVPRQEVKTWIWPVEVGRTWKYEVPVASGTQVWVARVKAWEDLDVPAGKFRAVRVERELIANPNPLVGRVVTVWYSPEAKANVKIQIHGTYEGSHTTTNYTRELESYNVQ